MNRIALLLLVASQCAAATFKPSLEGKKLISYGADWPNTAYVRQHIAEMEKHPFDGIVIGISETREPQLNNGTLGIKAWGKIAYQAKDYEHAIEDLKATKFQKFTDNFLQVEAMPGDVDWFDDQQWNAVVNNFRVLAHVAKEGGCVGLEFDPEQYGAEYVFTPLAWSDAKRNGHSEEQYKAKAIERGQQLIKAMNAEFPGIKILCLFGPALAQLYSQSPKHDYMLLAPFLEGMCRAADDKTEIIDGFEQSYGYRVEPAFVSARDAILKARLTFADPSAFDRVMRVGFGLWTDNGSGQRGWFPDQPEKNHFQPATWQNAVHFALKYSDRYVWVWREQIHEWENKSVGAGYEEAQRAARNGPAEIKIERRSTTQFGGKRQNNREDRGFEGAFGELLDRNRVLVDLTTPGWQFRPDPGNEGLTAKRDWSDIAIGQFWEEQGWDYDGYAWYRRTINLTEAPAGKVQIVFAGVDESAWVYLNRQQVGEHEVGESGWDQPFAIDLTGKLNAGKNELAVKVLDRTGPGGIWKPVAILQEHVEATKGKKLIEYGWDCPDTGIVRAHIREMEKRPFDGVVIRPAIAATQPGVRMPSLGRTVFQRRKFEPAEYQNCIDDLHATKFEKFTDNFIQVLSQPADVDWFDPAWQSIPHNVRAMARIAREGKCVGLMFDPEEYGANKLWTYKLLPAELRNAHTPDEYRAQVRQRGQEFIRAINAELPNAKILCLFGPAITFGHQRDGQGGYSLLAPFVEGMCRGADAGTRIIDGYEQSYMYRTRTSFRAGRRDMSLARLSFEDVNAFDRVMRVGFGLWIDNDSHNRPWDDRNFINNYFQPDTWQDAIYHGLSSSDEYVWAYTETPDWWTGDKLPREYEAAQFAGREKPANTHVARPNTTPAKFIKHAAPSTQPIETKDLLVDLTPGTWLFRIDPDDSGVERKWFAAHDSKDWSPIAIGKFWSEQDWDFDGYAWYRRKFQFSNPPAKNVKLVFGAVDESAEVYLNGEKIGSHDLGEYGWDLPFSIDLAGKLREGDNELVVRVLNRAGPGGIWKPVGIYSVAK